MAVRPPGKDELAAIARGYGMHLSDEDLGSFGPLVAGLLSSYDAVEEMYAQTAPQPPAGRTWKRPDPAQNPLGAWYVRTEITEQPDGPLAGRRVAIKDNIEVAGLPMMNGSATVEGFVPRRDATVVTRLLDAGATITGKAVCEDLCFSGGSHTSRTGPVHNPRAFGHHGIRGSIGFGGPVAVGAAVACPDRKVICMIGDGSAMYTIQSLWTMARENLDVCVMIFSNRNYKILYSQLADVGAANPGPRAIDMLTLDRPTLQFTELAKGMGVPAAKAHDLEELTKQLTYAMSQKGPYLIDVVM